MAMKKVSWLHSKNLKKVAKNLENFDFFMIKNFKQNIIILILMFVCIQAKYQSLDKNWGSLFWKSWRTMMADNNGWQPARHQISSAMSAAELKKSSQRLPNTPVCQHQWMPVSVPRLRTWSRSQGPHSGDTLTQNVVQPTECINRLSNWYLETFRKKCGKLSRGRDLIVMKPKLDVSCQLPDVYTRFQLHISKRVEKSSENFLVAGSSAEMPLLSVCGHQRAKNCQAMTKISTVARHLLCKYVYQMWALYIIAEWRKITLTHFLL